MIGSNAHTHTNFCDGLASAEDVVLAAIGKGFHTLGFSGHSFTAYDTSYCMTDVCAYVAEIRRLREKYSAQIAVFCGLELDAYGQRLFTPDYVIGSVHCIHYKQAYYCVDESEALLRRAIAAFDGDTLAFAAEYYHQVVQMARKERPDIIGHFDLPMKFNCGNRCFDSESAQYLHIAEQAMREILPYCTLFEVNTGAMARGYTKQPYPSPQLLEILFRLGGEVMITSDCHEPQNLDYGFVQAQQLLQRIGFRETVTLTPEGFRRVEL